jgi:tRNA-2-methylthio-N6-dimethylallyladenosine synthase
MSENFEPEAMTQVADVDPKEKVDSMSQESPDEPKLVYMETFGCQMNILDSELAMQQLASRGFSVTETMNQADLIVLNTCAVRDHAEHKIRSRLGMLRQRKHRKDGAVVAVMGCMAQREGEAILERHKSVDLVVGTKSFLDLPELYEDAVKAHERKVAAEIAHEFRYTRDVQYRGEPHRAWVSIMRGCDLKCSYCVVPKTRGAEQSRAMEDIIDEVRRLVDDGVKEITLLGQTVNSWGKQLQPRRQLADLLETLEEVPGLLRVRFITSHPRFFMNDFWDRIKPLKKVCRYMHVPAQHGSDRILDAMKRLYTRGEYLDMVQAAKAAIPEIALASDWIVGYPSETEEEYESCESLIREVDFQGSFVFKYSPRPDTPAFGLLDDVHQTVKDDRCRRLLAVQEAVSRARNEKAVGQTFEVLVDGPSKTNSSVMSGRTDDNRIVIFEAPESTVGELVQVKVQHVSPFSLYGDLVARVSAPGLSYKPRRLPVLT